MDYKKHLTKLQAIEKNTQEQINDMNTHIERQTDSWNNTYDADIYKEKLNDIVLFLDSIKESIDNMEILIEKYL